VDHDAIARPCARQLRQKHRIDSSPVEAARGAVDAACGSRIPPCFTDPLLLKLLAATVNTDLELEQFLTEARRHLGLSPTLPSGLNPFLAALALQCFNNGYAFATTAEEETSVAALRSLIEDELLHGAELESALEQKLLRFALYEPLTALRPAKRLLDLPIPRESPLGAVLTRCLTEPLEEAALARKLPSLGPIENAVSQAVRDQYEEHPYPRWLSLPGLAPASFSAMLRRSIPHAQPPYLGGPIEVLVAGCGTGRQPIVTALSLAQARVLAVDLSLKSLGYAKRMAVRLGASNVEFLHADLLALGRLRREFHVVEAVGVLHHMQDPLAGWRVLCGLLRPGGFMRIGLYSALARSEVIVTRERIASLGLTPTPRDMRAFRRRVLLGDESERSPGLALSKDIYDLNGCRDLVFHAREHCYTIPELQAMLQALGLEFLGFDFAGDGAARRYRAENPNDPSAANLSLWARFEAAHPDTFSGMYVFWCRKPENE
jgi:SAM-dependent methyltransferase